MNYFRSTSKHISKHKKYIHIQTLFCHSMLSEILLIHNQPRHSKWKLLSLKKIIKYNYCEYHHNNSVIKQQILQVL